MSETRHMSRKAEREAWSAFVQGREVKTNKYGVAPKAERGKYASKYEAEVAGKLATWQRIGAITDLQEQVAIVLVPGNGRVKPIKYIADFVYLDAKDGTKHVVDAKGCKTAIYRLKKKLAALLLGIEIEEV